MESLKGDPMQVLTFLVLVFLLTGKLFAANLVNINPLGASSKGQYYAIEEFGIKQNTGRAFSRIQVINTWKETQVKVVERSIPYSGEGQVEVESMRQAALESIRPSLNQYGIRLR